MKRIGRYILIYFPLYYVIAQTAANLWFVLSPSSYSVYSYDIACQIGGSVWPSIFFVIYTFYLKLCKISRVCAIAELFVTASNQLIKDNVDYNTLLQLVFGSLGILVTLFLLADKKHRQWTAQS